MLKKTLIFQNACHLNIKYKQLVITAKTTGEINQRPVEDVGFVLLDHPQITFTQAVMQHFAEQNTAVIFCNKKHHPSSMLFHLDTHQVQSEHFRAQVESSLPLKKQLWQQTIKSKIRNQAVVLDVSGFSGDALRYMAKKVNSGDTTNQEARAARYYWPVLFGDDFIRNRFGLPPNNLLNYGYAILRAAVARSLMGSGLLPTLGIHHRNKYNAFCLADDIMEPYRPFVDLHVCELYDAGLVHEDLSTDNKTEMLSVLTADVMIHKKKRPLMIALSETTASLSRCYKGEALKIRYPVL